jgi:septal ring factor EnvC (AmiA/AmiB activator)
MELFEQIYLKSLREMSRASSTIVGILCATLLERRKQIDPNWQSKESLKEVVDETVRRGCGTDENLILQYSEQENASSNRFEAYLTNVINVIKEKMKHLLTNESIVFTFLRRFFEDHFRNK